MTFFSGVYGTAVGHTEHFGDVAKGLIGLCGIFIGVGEIVGKSVQIKYYVPFVPNMDRNLCFSIAVAHIYTFGIGLLDYFNSEFDQITSRNTFPFKSVWSYQNGYVFTDIL